MKEDLKEKILTDLENLISYNRELLMSDMDLAIRIFNHFQSLKDQPNKKESNNVERVKETEKSIHENKTCKAKELVDNKIFDLHQKLISKLDNIIIEGLRRKGYIFINKEDLANFIKSSCDSIKVGNVITYRVKGKPFLLYEENYKIDFSPDMLTVKAEAGGYTFI